VKFLKERYIEGKESVEVVIDTQEEEKSTNVEKLLLSNYLKKLEKRIFNIDNIQGDVKLNLYNVIDNVVNLVACNKVNAKDAIAYIKDTVNNMLAGEV
jgi:hypothetical protein